MNKTKIWKSVPSVPGVEVNQYGVVNMLDYVECNEDGEHYIKGGIRKQRDRGNGYQAVDVFYDGKWYTKFVHRLVAETFIPNPNNLAEVNHKDCNRTNNSVENLEWCTREYNQQYREKYGVSNTEVLGHPLWVADLGTGEKLHLRSQNEASRELGVHRASIGKVIRGQQKYAGNYYFTEDENEITKEKLQEIKNSVQDKSSVIAVNLKTLEIFHFKSQYRAARELCVSSSNINSVLKGKKNQTNGYFFTEDEGKITQDKLCKIKAGMHFLGGVIMVNLKTQEVLRFKYQKEASRESGASAGNICNVLTGRYKQTKGFWFCHADENAVENARSKFGDAVADQVADLMSEK